MPTETKIANPTAQHTPPTRCHHDEPEDQCEPCTLTAERDRLREQNAALLAALDDPPSDLAALNATAAEINGQIIPDAMLVAHLNAQHGYTIPPDAKQLEKAYIITGLHREHAARHVQQVAQEHQRMTQDEADAFFDARAYRDGVR